MGATHLRTALGGVPPHLVEVTSPSAHHSLSRAETSAAIVPVSRAMVSGNTDPFSSICFVTLPIEVIGARRVANRQAFGAFARANAHKVLFAHVQQFDRLNHDGSPEAIALQHG